jgi:hypothetical protein
MLGCPVCGSESFAYITRWVPAPERGERPRPVPVSNAETYRQLLSPERVPPKGMRWVIRGAFGVAVVSLGRWMWLRRPTPDE